MCAWDASIAILRLAAATSWRALASSRPARAGAPATSRRATAATQRNIPSRMAASVASHRAIFGDRRRAIPRVTTVAPPGMRRDVRAADLPLRSSTTPAWARAALAQTAALLDDHAHLERKAASNALASMTRAPDGLDAAQRTTWARTLAAVACD